VYFVIDRDLDIWSSRLYTGFCERSLT